MLAAPGWQADVKGFLARVFCPDGKPSKTFSTAENITLQ